MRRSSLILVVATLGVAGLAVGCATKSVAPAPADTGPAANTAVSAVKRFEWATNHRAAAAVHDLLTDDFQFIAASIDSAGNPGRVPYGRGWFRDALAAMVDSSQMVTCILDQTPLSFHDTRPGKDPRFHRQVRTSIDLRVRIDAGETVEVTGSLLFFVTRGDSASIPAELQARGVRPDSTRWWFDRLDDETLGRAALPAATEPTRNQTFAALLALFYSSFVAR